MIQHIEAFLSERFPVHASYLKPIAGEIVQVRRMTDPLATEDHWDDLLPSEHGVGDAVAGEYDELRANLAFEQALWRFDLALAAFRERIMVN